MVLNLFFSSLCTLEYVNYATVAPLEWILQTCLFFVSGLALLRAEGSPLNLNLPLYYYLSSRSRRFFAVL